MEMNLMYFNSSPSKLIPSDALTAGYVKVHKYTVKSLIIIVPQTLYVKSRSPQNTLWRRVLSSPDRLNLFKNAAVH